MASSGEDPLRWHGDDELGAGPTGALIDLAVNVRRPAPPAWLAEVLAGTIGELGAYPDAGPARRALAARHQVAVEQVLPTAGGAEVFTLVARGSGVRRAAVVHPQFTEPEAALRAAGVPVERVLLPGPDFALDPDLVPADADLVVVGNPTNPTGVLHPAATLRALARPGRVLLVDEAFMDAVPTLVERARNERVEATPTEPESLISPVMPGVLVARSLTKTWGLAGIRAGYAVGDPTLIDRLAAQQPHWSVSTPALAAMVATSSPEALAEAGREVASITEQRAHLVTRLREAGLEIVGGRSAPFVLTRGPVGLRERLRAEGFAVRRCDTFPGLDERYLRLAVREPVVSDALAAALGRALGH
ncbi:aminotransferase [Enemella evansiae]|uniref:Rv2231c family pyridoxal phosphate-dependent protein CobC n=1 Tax=Enemella evansiae TaxID=2016499 RepID=UPI000B96933C|nr:Rv2231c family pyridoxal phosphate-dependent protein CobC [Enemella evansiae]OYN98499.1 aminotransferase [Enemella evansiae]